MSRTRVAKRLLLVMFALAVLCAGPAGTLDAQEDEDAAAQEEPALTETETGGSGGQVFQMIASGGVPLFVIFGLFAWAIWIGVRKALEFRKTRAEKVQFADRVIDMCERVPDLAKEAFPGGEVPPEDSQPYVCALIVGAKSEHCAADLEQIAPLSASAPALVRFALGGEGAKPQDMELALDNKIELDMLPQLRKGVSTLATIAKGAPMLGLLGTVWGMIGAFARIASATNVNPNELADNIGFALTTTAAGLFAAIPALIFHAFCQSKIRGHEMTLRKFAAQLVDES